MLHFHTYFLHKKTKIQDLKLHFYVFTPAPSPPPPPNLNKTGKYMHSKENICCVGMYQGKSCPAPLRGELRGCSSEVSALHGCACISPPPPSLCRYAGVLVQHTFTQELNHKDEVHQHRVEKLLPH